jgi:hypothetical protein
MNNMRAMDRQVNASAANVLRANPILQGLGQGLGLAAVGSAALATKAVTDMVFTAIDASSDLRESVTLSDQVFEGNSKEMQEWAAGAADQFGQSKREALTFAAGFGTAFKNVGTDLETTSEQSRELTRLAADLGSAFNRSSEEAATALRSGLLGETEPMRRFGVFLSEAAVQAKAVEMGIADLGDELTDTQKVAARYAIIMEQTADSQGMFGRDTESLADAQKALAAEWENLSAKGGELLLPLMVDLAKTMNEEGIPAIENEIAGLEKLGSGIGRISGELGGLIGELQLWADYSADFLSFWDGSLTMAEHRARSEARKIAESMAFMADASKDDLVSMHGPIDGVADSAAVMAGRIVRSNADVIASYDAMRARMASAASGAAEAIYGPLIAKGQLAATEREIAAQREIIATGRSTSAGVSGANQVSEAHQKAIDKQIESIEALEAAADRAFAKSIQRYSDEIEAQLGIIDAEEQARRNAKRDAQLAEQISTAQADVAEATEPEDKAAATKRLNDLIEQQEENRLTDAANARRQELRDVQDQIDEIVKHEREAVDQRKALVEARANAAAIANDIAAAREAGDLQKVADLQMVLEAQKAEIAHLALEARHKDRVADLEREKALLGERSAAVGASGAVEVADAKARLAELQATRIEQLATLAAFGDEAAATTLLFSQEIQQALIEGNEEVKARILELRHELAMLRLDALATAGALDFAGGMTQGDRPETGSPFAGARAAGGPVRKDDVYLVGEEGREAFVPWTNGSIIPNDAFSDGRQELRVPESVGSPAFGEVGGGGTIQQIHVNVTFQGPVLDPYGDFTQRFAEQLQPALARAAARSGVAA